MTRTGVEVATLLKHKCNFINIQSSHTVPVKSNDRSRIRTGYERVIGQRTTRMFAGIAEDAGKVVQVDEGNNIVEVEYTNGRRDIFTFGEEFTTFEGFQITQPIKCCVKAGDTFKAGDVLTYNTGFFTQDPYTKQLDYSIGVMATLAVMELDTTNEDSAEISERLAEKLTMAPVNTRVVTLNKDSVVYKCVGVGDEVSITDDLMVFEEEPMDGLAGLTTDEETLALISDLNRRTPSAKFTGKIVKVEAYTGCELKEMHPSLASIVRSAIAGKNKRASIAKGTGREEDFPPVTVMPEGSKYKGVMFDKETVCLIFHIQEHTAMHAGDKLVVCHQLKCTTAGVFPKPIYSESGKYIDVFFSVDAIARRGVMSPTLFGISSRIMEKIEDDVVKMYFEE